MNEWTAHWTEQPNTAPFYLPASTPSKKISNFLPSDFQKHLAINTTMAITKTVLFNIAGA